jgi:hypothetical protein
MVAALPHESLRLVVDLVESPPAETPNDDIKERLVASHQISNFQKAERLFLMPPLGGRKPSEMMAAMLETCPRGEEKTNLFACIFLQCLPREIRVLFARVDHKDPKELARQADEFQALHDNTIGGAITAIQQDCAEGDFVAAVRAGDRQRGGSDSRGHGQGGRGRGGRGNGQWASLLISGGAGGFQGGQVSSEPLYQTLEILRAGLFLHLLS